MKPVIWKNTKGHNPFKLTLFCLKLAEPLLHIQHHLGSKFETETPKGLRYIAKQKQKTQNNTGHSSAILLSVRLHILIYTCVTSRNTLRGMAPDGQT